MRGKDKISKLIIIISALVAVVLLVIGATDWTRLTLAAPPALPPRPGYNPGGSGTNDNGGSDDDDESNNDEVGAHIELQIQPEQVELWTVVQWQDSAGGWHNVEGWRGFLEANGGKRWWVAAKDFDTGPFRWVVYQKPNGQPVATSIPFHLPYANQINYIQVSLGP